MAVEEKKKERAGGGRAEGEVDLYLEAMEGTDGGIIGAR